MKVGDLVRDITDPSGEVGILIRIVENHEDSDLVMVKYSNAKLFIYTRDLQLISASAAEGTVDE